MRLRDVQGRLTTGPHGIRLRPASSPRPRFAGRASAQGKRAMKITALVILWTRWLVTPWLIASFALILSLGSGVAAKSQQGEAKTQTPRPTRNPLVRVVTVSQDGISSKSTPKGLEATYARLDQAAAFQPDIVCLPEGFTRGQPETVPGPTTRRLAKWARRHACYVIGPIPVRMGENVLNSAVLIDRTGHVTGRYDKIRPTEGELNRPICPGALDPPVFQTDFGIIGIQICFDINWRDQWRRLKAKGAQIIFFPSAYPAARQLRTIAWLNQCFLVSSTRNRASSIYDITGEKIISTDQYHRWVGAVLPLGERLFETDFHVDKMRQIEKKYGAKVRVTWYHDDDLVTLASLDPQLTVDDLIQQFQLTPHTAYIRRAEKAQDARRRQCGSQAQTVVLFSGGDRHQRDHHLGRSAGERFRLHGSVPGRRRHSESGGHPAGSLDIDRAVAEVVGP